MNSTLVKSLIISLSLLNLSACSTIQSYFPDKEKDYQFSSELPQLKIPTQVTNKGLEKKPVNKQMMEDTETVAVIGEMVKTSSATATTATPAPTVTPEPEKVEPTQVELVKFKNGETRLQINKSVPMSWRIVAKALSRKTIEITARDQANAEFAVQYDPNETDYKDETVLDEINFVFGKDHSHEKPYHIKLLAREKTTEVVVLDEQNKLFAHDEGLSLLKLLSTTIKADLADDS